MHIWIVEIKYLSRFSILKWSKLSLDLKWIRIFLRSQWHCSKINVINYRRGAKKR